MRALKKDGGRTRISLGTAMDLHPGDRRHREARVWDVEETPHLLAAGGTGFGTSTLAMTLVAHALRHEGGWEHRWFAGSGAGDPDLAVLGAGDAARSEAESLAEESRRRLDLLALAGVTDIAAYNALRGAGEPWREGLRRVLVVVERPELYGRGIMDGFNAFARHGRAVGIHLAVIANRPTAMEIGGAFRALLVGRLLLGGLTPSDSHVVIEEAVGSELDSLPGARPGSGVYLPGFGRPSTDVQIANTSAEDLKRLADGDRAGAGGDRP